MSTSDDSYSEESIGSPSLTPSPEKAPGARENEESNNHRNASAEISAELDESLSPIRAIPSHQSQEQNSDSDGTAGVPSLRRPLSSTTATKNDSDLPPASHRSTLSDGDVSARSEKPKQASKKVKAAEIQTQAFIVGVLGSGMPFDRFRTLSVHQVIRYISSTLQTDKQHGGPSPPRKSKASGQGTSMPVDSAWALHWSPQRLSANSSRYVRKAPIWVWATHRLPFMNLVGERGGLIPDSKRGPVFVDLLNEAAAAVANKDLQFLADAIFMAEKAFASKFAKEAPPSPKYFVSLVEQMCILCILASVELINSDEVDGASRLLTRAKELCRMKGMRADMKAFIRSAVVSHQSAMQRRSGALQTSIASLDRSISTLRHVADGSMAPGLSDAPAMINRGAILAQLGKYDLSVAQLEDAISQLHLESKAVGDGDGRAANAIALEAGCAYFNMGLALELSRQHARAFECYREAAKVCTSSFGEKFPLSIRVNMAYMSCVEEVASDPLLGGREWAIRELEALNAASSGASNDRRMLQTPPWQKQGQQREVLPLMSKAEIQGRSQSSVALQPIEAKEKKAIEARERAQKRKVINDELTDQMPILRMVFDVYANLGQATGQRSRTMDMQEFLRCAAEFEIYPSRVGKTDVIEVFKQVMKKVKKQLGTSTMEADFAAFIDVLKAIGAVVYTDQESDAAFESLIADLRMNNLDSVEDVMQETGAMPAKSSSLGLHKRVNALKSKVAVNDGSDDLDSDTPDSPTADHVDRQKSSLTEAPTSISEPVRGPKGDTDEETRAQEDDEADLFGSKPTTAQGSTAPSAQELLAAADPQMLEKMKAMEEELSAMKSNLASEARRRKEAQKHAAAARRKLGLRVAAVMSTKLESKLLTKTCAAWLAEAKHSKKTKRGATRLAARLLFGSSANCFQQWSSEVSRRKDVRMLCSSIAKSTVERAIDYRSDVGLFCNSILLSVLDKVNAVIDRTAVEVNMSIALEQAVEEVQNQSTQEKKEIERVHRQLMENQKLIIERDFKKLWEQKQLELDMRIVVLDAINSAADFVREKEFMQHLAEVEGQVVTVKSQSAEQKKLLEEHAKKLQAKLDKEVENMQAKLKAQEESANSSKSNHYKRVMAIFSNKTTISLTKDMFMAWHAHAAEAKLTAIKCKRVIMKLQGNSTTRCFYRWAHFRSTRSKVKGFSREIVNYIVDNAATQGMVNEIEVERMKELQRTNEKSLRRLMGMMQERGNKEIIVTAFSAFKEYVEEVKRIKHTTKRLMARMWSGSTARYFLMWSDYISGRKEREAAVSSVIEHIFNTSMYEASARELQKQREQETLALQMELSRLSAAKRDQQKQDAMDALLGKNDQSRKINNVRNHYRRVLSSTILRINRANNKSILQAWHLYAKRGSRIAALHIRLHQRRLVRLSKTVMMSWAYRAHRDKYSKQLTDKAIVIQKVMNTLARMDRDMKLLQSAAEHKISSASVRIEAAQTWTKNVQKEVARIQLTDRVYLERVETMRDDVMSLETQLGLETRKRTKLEAQVTELQLRIEEYEVLEEEMRAERRDMERQFERAKADLTRQMIAEREDLQAAMQRDQETAFRKLRGEQEARTEADAKVQDLERKVSTLDSLEDMLYRERQIRQRAEKSIVEMARALGTLKACLIQHDIPIPDGARPSSAVHRSIDDIQRSGTNKGSENALRKSAPSAINRRRLPPGAVAPSRRAWGTPTPTPGVKEDVVSGDQNEDLKHQYGSAEETGDVQAEGANYGQEYDSEASWDEEDEDADPYFSYDVDGRGDDEYGEEDLTDALEYMPADAIDDLVQRGIISQAEEGGRQEVDDAYEADRTKYARRFLIDQ